MTRIQALLKSIVKYQWYADNPFKVPPEGSDMDRCALCDQCPGNCKNCVMYGYWPVATGTTNNCDEDYSAWDRWDDFEFDMENQYDRTFFSLIMVETFESRLRDVYKERKNG